MKSGRLRHSVEFEAESGTPDGYGGVDRAWVGVHACRAEFRYKRGSEGVDAGALVGVASFKVRVRSCEAARGLTAEHRMRDTRSGKIYNIREVDTESDKRWVWLVAESGVAV